MKGPEQRSLALDLSRRKADRLRCRGRPQPCTFDACTTPERQSLFDSHRQSRWFRQPNELASAPSRGGSRLSRARPSARTSVSFCAMTQTKRSPGGTASSASRSRGRCRASTAKAMTCSPRRWSSSSSTSTRRNPPRIEPTTPLFGACPAPALPGRTFGALPRLIVGATA